MSALSTFCKQRVSSGVIQDDAEGRFSAALREPLIAFATTATAYIGGAQGKYEPFNTRMEYPALDVEHAYASFVTHLDGFLRFVGTGKPAIAGVSGANSVSDTNGVSGTDTGVSGTDTGVSGTNTGVSGTNTGVSGTDTGVSDTSVSGTNSDVSGANTGVSGTNAALPLFESLRATAVDTPHIAAFALGYALLSTLRAIIGKGASGAEAVALAEHWSLDRKLREVYVAFGISGDTAYWVTEIAKAVLVRTAPEDTSSASLSALAHLHGVSLAETIVLANYEAEDFRRLLKVNRFNDITWFNKEAFECVLFYAPLFLLMETADAFTPAASQPVGVKTPAKAKYAAKLSGFERADMIEQIAEAFHASAAESGYRFDTLIELLSDAGKKAKE